MSVKAAHGFHRSHGSQGQKSPLLQPSADASCNLSLFALKQSSYNICSWEQASKTEVKRWR